MDKRSFVSLVALLFLVFQAACGPAPQVLPAPIGLTPLGPTPIAPTPVEPTGVGPTSVGPTAVAPTAAPPVLAMKVGTSFSYFDGSLLVPVPAGPFIMGGGGSDNPIHTVYLSDFWIYTTEVTNRMYSLCVAAGKCSPPDATDNPIFNDAQQGNRPVVGLIWQQAADYCDFAHGRLPTEAEWEKTARGPDGRLRPWGDEPPSCERLNFGSCIFQTTNVGLYPKGQSYYNAFDLAGNVFEWVSDRYLASYYGAAPTQDPLGPEVGDKRSVRSTSFNSDGFLTESARRFSAQPDQHRADLGFRCVVEDPTYFAPFCTTLGIYGRVPPGGPGSAGIAGPDCTVVTMTQSQMCIDKQPYTTVILTTDGGEVASVGDLGNCELLGSTPTGFKYLCDPTDVGSFNVCPRCTPPGSAELSCADGYTLVGTQCVLKQGWPGRCPEGATYDPTRQCCTPPTGIRSIYDLDCPSGFYPFVDGDTITCTAIAAVPCQPFSVDYKTCGGNQPNCDPALDPNCAPVPCDPQTDPNGCRPPNTNCPPGTTGPNCTPTGCLPTQTRIDTPAGRTAVAALQVGDLVWTIDSAGNRVVSAIVQVARTPVRASHEMVHLLLADGRELQASTGHPTADGRMLGDLRVGDTLDGALITLAEIVPYGQPATYDLLPSGETGFYWANGILLGSTLSGR